eukprot:SAG31_NODE_166_length_21670_cov_22.507719_4_plen_226_part_00
MVCSKPTAQGGTTRRKCDSCVAELVGSERCTRRLMNVATVPYKVVWKRVAVRQAPNVSAAIIGAFSAGEIILTCCKRGNWVQLTGRSVPYGAKNGQAHMMVDGTGVGCGVLLEPNVHVRQPAVEFAAVHAIIFTCDEAIDDFSGDAWNGPLSLEIRQQDPATAEETLSKFDAVLEARQSGESDRFFRLGGLQPDTSLEARFFVDIGGATLTSRWLTARTRYERNK